MARTKKQRQKHARRLARLKAGICPKEQRRREMNRKIRDTNGLRGAYDPTLEVPGLIWGRKEL